MSEFGRRIRPYVEREIFPHIKPPHKGNQPSPSHTWNVPTYLGRHQRLSMFARIGTCFSGGSVSATSENVWVSCCASPALPSALL